MCSQLLTPPNKSQTLRHSLYGNGVFLCKTPYGESNGLLGIIHHNVEELQQKLEKNELKTDLISDENELETKADASKVRVLIVQDPISKVLSAFADEYKAKHGKSLTSWDDHLRGEFKKYMQYVISSGYRTDQRLLRQGAICSVCQMTYTFVIKLESFDQDMRELCHQLNVDNKDTCNFLIEVEHDSKLNEQLMRNHRNLFATAFEGIDLEVIEEFIDIYRSDYEMFKYRIPKIKHSKE